jgi:gamma-glutamyltranspeptidase/glutathione hydrolase
MAVNSEVTMREATMLELKARGHSIATLNDPYMDFGSGQFAWRLEEEGQFTGYIAASDARKDGHAAGV